MAYYLLNLCYNLRLMLDIASYQDAHLLSPAAARQDAILWTCPSFFFSTEKCLYFNEHYSEMGQVHPLASDKPN